MSTPCGKCNTCPCTGKRAQTPPANPSDQAGSSYQQPPATPSNRSNNPEYQPSPAAQTPRHTGYCDPQVCERPQASQYREPPEPATPIGQTPRAPSNRPSQQHVAAQQQQQQRPTAATRDPYACERPPESKKHDQDQEEKRPRVECLCAGNRNKPKKTSPFQAPLADTYTCSRPRPEQRPELAPIEERCTCKAKQAPPQCECAPPPPLPPPISPEQERQEQHAQRTHANVTCGQPTPYRPVRQQHRTREQQRDQCSHCQSQKKAKKCVIQ